MAGTAQIKTFTSSGSLDKQVNDWLKRMGFSRENVSFGTISTSQQQIGQVTHTYYHLLVTYDEK